jgi:hypothetical protein
MKALKAELSNPAALCLFVSVVAVIAGSIFGHFHLLH